MKTVYSSKKHQKKINHGTMLIIFMLLTFNILSFQSIAKELKPNKVVSAEVSSITTISNQSIHEYIKPILDDIENQVVGPGKMSKHKFDRLVKDFEKELYIYSKEEELVKDPNIKVDFDWEMEERYGLDANDNGIIDIPNTLEYVYPCPNNSCIQAVFKIILSIESQFSGAGMGRPQAGRYRHNGPPRLGIVSKFLKELETSAHVEYNNLRVSFQRYDISVEDENNQTIKRKTNISAQDMEHDLQEHKLKYILQLSEGNLRIKITAKDYFDNTYNEITKEILVEDILIVNLGDSFASGEGNPEKTNIPFVIDASSDSYRANLEALIKYAGERVPIWADDGSPIEYRLVTEETRSTIFSVLGRGKIGIYKPKYSQFTKERREHYLSHRSSYAATSQLALRLEKENPKTSVTYISLAMSGATIKDGVLTSYEGKKSEPVYRSGELMMSQLNRLRELVNGRTIDHLFISIGGNDIGFAAIIASLLAKDSDLDDGPTFGLIKQAFYNGNWGEVQLAYGKPFPFVDTYAADLLLTETSGLNNLDDYLNDLYQTLNNYSNMPFKKAYLIQYPTMDRNTNGVLCDELLSTISVGVRKYGIDITIDLEINSAEIRWMNGKELDSLGVPIKGVYILNKLNNKLKNFVANTQDNKWVFIDGVMDISKRHGLCTGNRAEPIYNPPSLEEMLNKNADAVERWYRRAKEANYIQGGTVKGTSGMVHPNIYGHNALMELLYNAIQ
jgi:lysophospholipase L1-like esterase